MSKPKEIVVIGGGIAGLCAAVYAQKSGYQATVFEMHESPGGLATSWRRSGYTFETCLHWLLGANPTSIMYSRWREVFDIDKLSWVHPEEYARLETERGERFILPVNPDRMEAELVKQAPEDTTEIRRLASAVREFAILSSLKSPTQGFAIGWRCYTRSPNYQPSAGGRSSA